MKTSTLLSPETGSERSLSIVSLLLRLAVGVAMLGHGIPKILAFSTLSTTFPNPIGLGPTLSLVLTIGAEVGCSILLIFGLLTRLAAIPLIFNMAVIYFIVHHSATFMDREVPLLYLALYIAIFILGGRRYSLDKILFNTK